MVAALLGVSLPGFVVAGVLIALFSDKLHWFPGGEVGAGGSQIVLPAFAISFLPMAYIARLTRAAA